MPVGKERAMMSLEVTKEELSLVRMLLEREQVNTRIEIHHARMSFEYRDYLKKRLEEIDRLLGKIKNLMGPEA
ncbi:MAG TPA: hypothetical protein PLW83_01080 [Deltaproteobacteria bacterium]|nr:hypothetical protein [Deltaproteobacteria bacterium]